MKEEEKLINYIAQNKIDFNDLFNNISKVMILRHISGPKNDSGTARESRTFPHHLCIVHGK